MSKKGWTARIAGAIGGIVLGIVTAGVGYLPAIAAGIGYYASHEAAVQLGSRYNFRRNLRKDSKKLYTSGDNIYKVYTNPATNQTCYNINGTEIPINQIEDIYKNKIIIPGSIYEKLWKKSSCIKMNGQSSRICLIKNGQIMGTYEIMISDQIIYNDGTNRWYSPDDLKNIILPEEHALNDEEIKLVPAQYLTNYVKSGSEDKKAENLSWDLLGRWRRRYDLWRGGVQPLKSFTIGGFREPKEVWNCLDENCTNDENAFFIPEEYATKKEIPLDTSVLREDSFYKVSKEYKVKSTDNKFKFKSHKYNDGWLKQIIRNWNKDTVINLRKDIKKNGKIVFFSLPATTEGTLEEILEL